MRSCVNIRVMNIRDNEGGIVNILLIPLIMSTVLFVAALGFGVWSFMSRQDYKDNSDQKVAAAVEVTKKQVSSQKDNEFLEKEKFPLRSYQGPAEIGSLSLSYPKTWSAYLSQQDGNSFVANPDIVSGARDTLYALRVTVEDDPYDEVIRSYDKQIKDGKLKATAFTLDKLPDVVGIRFDGEVERDKPGVLVVLPLRDKTVKIACEIPDRAGDFNNIILPNISFIP